MKIENGILTINPTIPQTDLEELYKYIKDNISDVKKIEFENNEPIATSGLISMIVSLQISENNIEIDLIKRKQEMQLAGIGLCEFDF
jgi:translation elongation factor EF-1beta